MVDTFDIYSLQYRHGKYPWLFSPIVTGFIAGQVYAAQCTLVARIQGDIYIGAKYEGIHSLCNEMRALMYEY